jgi:hypothetical protein
MSEQLKNLKFIPCTCGDLMRVVYIDDKPYVHPEDLEHMKVCPSDDPKTIKENQDDLERMENYY